FEDLIEEQKIALVHFDKRGIGNSTGKWYKTTLEERAEDVKEVAKFLSKIEYIDTSKIYVVGHSQGGWIVQYCLANYGEFFAGGISMAGATFSVRKQLINDF